jgi:hypothetical protein
MSGAHQSLVISALLFIAAVFVIWQGVSSKVEA